MTERGPRTEDRPMRGRFPGRCWGGHPMGWFRITIPRKTGDIQLCSGVCLREWDEDRLLATILEE